MQVASRKSGSRKIFVTSSMFFFYAYMCSLKEGLVKYKKKKHSSSEQADTSRIRFVSVYL